VRKSAGLLIVLGGACVLAWLVLGIGYLHSLTGWQFEAGSMLGPMGIILLLGGVSLARRQKSA
jgi:predicted phage tail protein